MLKPLYNNIDNLSTDRLVDNRLRNANWITTESFPEEAAPTFEKEFYIEKKADEVKKSEIYISGLGFYVLKINGRRVGEDILQPAFSNYNKTVYYNVYDIFDYLNFADKNNGKNVIEVTLGNGWLNEFQTNGWSFENAIWRKRPLFIAEVYVNADLSVKTDLSWRCTQSRTVYNSLRGGETYDASIAEKEDYRSVMVADPPFGILKEQKINPIRLEKTIEPTAVIKNSPYDFVYDFGENLSGNVEIEVEAVAGLHVVIQYTERLFDGHLPNLEPISHCVNDKRFQQDFVITGEGVTKWHGEFSYHGFRYVRVCFTPGATIKSINARCFHTVVEDMGGIDTDNPIIAKIQNAIRRSTLTNLHHMPTDCPHREKNGWAADGYLSCGQALMNFDMTNIYEKWLDDFVDCQMPNGKIPCIAPTCGSFGYGWGSGPSWDLVIFDIPWKLYLCTGDKKYLSRYFKPMQKYIDYLETITCDGICTLGLGEWCAVQSMGDVIPDNVVIQMSVYAIHRLFRKIAIALGDISAAEEASRREQRTKTAFIENYGNLNLENQLYYAGQVYFDLFKDDDSRNNAKNRLVEVVEGMDCHIYGGIFNAYLLLKVLTEMGRFDLAYKIAMQTDFPGWSYMVDITGGSTLAEEFYGGASLNHHMFSPIGEWFYSGIAGINIDEENPGFKNIIIKPNIPDEINCFKAWHNTSNGKVEVSIAADEIRVAVPKNSTAQFKYKGCDEALTEGEYSFKR